MIMTTKTMINVDESDDNNDYDDDGIGSTVRRIEIHVHRIQLLHSEH